MSRLSDFFISQIKEKEKLVLIMSLKLFKEEFKSMHCILDVIINANKSEDNDNYRYVFSCEDSKILIVIDVTGIHLTPVQANITKDEIKELGIIKTALSERDFDEETGEYYFLQDSALDYSFSELSAEVLMKLMYYFEKKKRK